ncbi:MAG: cache domain-containing protein, partial [Pleurocapsa sp.]
MVKFLDAHKMYNSVAVYDAAGELMVNSEGKPASNHKNKIYFQEAVRTKQAFIGQPRVSKSSGSYAVYTSAPIYDTKTGELVGVIRARMLVESIQDIIGTGKFLDTYVLDRSGKVFVASNPQEKQRILTAENQEVPLSEFFDFHQELQAGLNRIQYNNIEPQQVRGGRSNLNRLNIFYGEIE